MGRYMNKRQIQTDEIQYHRDGCVTLWHPIYKRMAKMRNVSVMADALDLLTPENRQRVVEHIEKHRKTT